MRLEFTAIYERDGEWVIAYCPEVPGANGQGRTKEEARTSLGDAIILILEDRRDEGLLACLLTPSAKPLLLLSRRREAELTVP
jgi:predicted RNase H-like HicB family nuclease